jgi:hypothetical protein
MLMLEACQKKTAIGVQDTASWLVAGGWFSTLVQKICTKMDIHFLVLSQKKVGVI